MVLDELNATQTYFKDNANIAHIISKHVKYMNNNNINWLPKLHKNPYGKRSIAASHKCTTKALSKLLTTCLTTITTHFAMAFIINCFWIINNSQQVLDKLSLHTINHFIKAKHFDFFTLYTSIHMSL